MINSDNLLIFILVFVHFAPWTFFGAENDNESSWLNKIVQACPLKNDASQAENWDVAEVNQFVDHIPWNVLIDAIESMQVNIQPKDRFLYIKRAMVTTLLEVNIPDMERRSVFVRLDRIADHWLSFEQDLERIDIYEFAKSLQWCIIILRARESANKTLARLAAKPLTGIYADIDKIQIYSKQLPKNVGKGLIASLNPIEKTCSRGYFSGCWWQPQTPDKAPVKREEDASVQGLFQVKGDNGDLMFLLRNNEDIGLVVPVNGITNILFVITTGPALNAIKVASDFVIKRAAD